MAGRRERLVRARKAAGVTQEDLAYRVGVDRSTVGRWECGETEPQPWHRRKIARQLGITAAQLDHLIAGSPPEPPPGNGDAEGEAEAQELVRRASASDVGEATLTQLEQLVDDLASSYATTQPAALLTRTRQHLRYVGQLLDGRKTLREHRRLLAAGGWLSLLAATLHVDLEQQAAAVARLRTSDSLARESGHDEIRAWALETEAWRVLTLGDYAQASSLSQGAQQLAPAGSSALIQATAQEGRAWARLGDARATTQAVSRVNRMASPLATPDRAEHHYRYDPAKATSYTATTLSWAGDPIAVDYAREVINRLSPGDQHGGRPRRLATARLDLALALLRRGDDEEATQAALAAVLSGRVVPSNWWRVREVVRAAEALGTGQALPLREAYEDLRAMRSSSSGT
ncbi:helix-turn-helix domain-containing protein [Pseudonocardia sp. MH-G8]|uniref:helix-turn-helix domain-containing protein n=1 Tax=Pseudonocardia sp. MH-G8 TaxID=1854588 RepID=UPI000BA04B3F|nr:helix-turn-helix transcriptional regulator [Pseudonocardia sp. MH-G8]OZM83601.1 transcriptional regulator [Pseudonocardia sp. MH-G8]